MGLFDAVGDALSSVGDAVGDVVGDVVDGVFDVVDDVFGIDLAKVLDNDFVKFGLMAASIFTGGVAIANGVMTGFSQATAAQGFMGKFVAGAQGFVKGVAQGFMNPIDTAGDLVGSAKAAMTGAPTTGGEMLAQGAAESGAQDLLQGVDSASSLNDGLGTSDIFSADYDMAANIGGGGPAPAAAGPSPMPTLQELKQAGMGADEYALSERALSGQVPAGAGPADINSPNFNMDAAIDASGPMKTGGGAQQKDWLGRLADSASSFVTSPAGVQMGLGMIQGYAQGEQMKAIFEERRKIRERAAESWEGGGTSAPRTWNIPALTELRARRQQLDQRGNTAQANYGY